MNKIYDALIFIGRFQPFHLAHEETIKIALQYAHHVIICLGSAQAERTLKNPFLVEERKQMILSNFNHSEQQRIDFTNIIDIYNDEKWKKLVQTQVAPLIKNAEKVGLIGYKKDESSYYLNIFPEWKQFQLPCLQNAISATPIREAYYQGIIQENQLPKGTVEFLHTFKTTEIYSQLKQEYFTSLNP